MIATEKAWARLVREVKKLNGFNDVRAYPFNRVNDAAFLKDFPGLKTPACLVVFLGRSTTARGAAADRECRWSCVVVTRDPGGNAKDEAVDLADEIEDNLLDQQLTMAGGAGTLTVHRTADVGVAFTSPRFAVYELSFTTREAEAR